MGTLSHLGHEVYVHDRDRFFLSLFVPKPQREILLALYALNIELAQVRGKISEEMIGQVRLAWWQERIEKLYEGHITPGHPVLEALQPVSQHVPKDMLLGLAATYRERFPEAPPDTDILLEQLSLQLLDSLCKDAKPHWQKAQNIIRRHRTRHAMRGNGWLALKLLIAGF